MQQRSASATVGGVAPFTGTVVNMLASPSPTHHHGSSKGDYNNHNSELKQPLKGGNSGGGGFKGSSCFCLTLCSPNSPSGTCTTNATIAAAITNTSEDPGYTITLPNLPPHRYTVANIGSRMPHMTYNVPDIEEIITSHRPTISCRDKLSIGMVKLVGTILNFVTRWDTSKTGVISKERWVARAVFLESVAAVPGMVAAMVRHLNSLRRMKRDHGWVRHLLEEADNERMHLFFFLREKNPSIIFRIFVWLTQVGFLVMNVTLYLFSPKTMHRFTGYLEEEAVHTYNCMMADIDSPDGTLREWRTKPAPKDMAAYYCLDTNTATFRDIIVCIRADEVGHREHNHMFADLHGEHTERFLPREELEMATFPSPAAPRHSSSGHHANPQQQLAAAYPTTELAGGIVTNMATHQQPQEDPSSGYSSSRWQACPTPIPAGSAELRRLPPLWAAATPSLTPDVSQRADGGGPLSASSGGNSAAGAMSPPTVPASSASVAAAATGGTTTVHRTLPPSKYFTTSVSISDPAYIEV